MFSVQYNCSIFRINYKISIFYHLVSWKTSNDMVSFNSFSINSYFFIRHLYSQNSFLLAVLQIMPIFYLDIQEHCLSVEIPELFMLPHSFFSFFEYQMFSSFRNDLINHLFQIFRSHFPSYVESTALPSFSNNYLIKRFQTFLIKGHLRILNPSFFICILFYLWIMCRNKK